MDLTLPGVGLDKAAEMVEASIEVLSRQIAQEPIYLEQAHTTP